MSNTAKGKYGDLPFSADSKAFPGHVVYAEPGFGEEPKTESKVNEIREQLELDLGVDEPHWEEGPEDEDEEEEEEEVDEEEPANYILAANMWTAILGKHVTERDVAACLVAYELSKYENVESGPQLSGLLSRSFRLAFLVSAQAEEDGTNPA